MRTRPLFIVVLFFLLGILFGKAYQITFLISAIIVLLLVKRKCSMRLFIIGALCACLSFSFGMVRIRSEIDKQEQSQLTYDNNKNESEVLLQGELYQKEEKNGQTLLYIQNSNLSKHSIIIYLMPKYNQLDKSWSDCIIGQTLLVKGKLNMFEEARNEGNFDRRAYFACNGIDLYMENPTLLQIQGRGSMLKERLYSTRREISKFYGSQLPEEEAGVLSTMVLGDKSMMKQEIRSLYSQIGLSHILSISGLHVSMIGATLYHFLRRRGLRYPGSASLSAIALLWYGNFTGASVSTRRAIIMLLLLMLADCFGRACDLLTSIAIAAALLLFSQPLWLFYSGFQLSFAAVFGAGFIARILISYVGNFHGVNKFVNVLLANLGVQIALLLFISKQFYELPTYGILTNLLLVPFAGIVLLFGMLAGVFYLFENGICLWFAMLFLKVSYAVLYVYRFIGNWILKLPMSNFILGTPGTVQISIYIGIVVLGLYWFKKNTSEDNKDGAKKWLRILLWFVALFFVVAFPKEGKAEVTMLDVGQGDGIYVRSQDGLNMFIDGGSSSVGKVGEKRILPFLKYRGVKHIDYWFISHLDEDHISGFIELLELGYPIENVVFANEQMVETESKVESKEKLFNLISERKINVIYMKEKDKFVFKNGSISCLFPTRDYRKRNNSQNYDPNEYCLTLLLELNGYNCFFGGDLTASGEAYLIDKLSKVNIYKVSHHGSKTSSSSAFLNQIKPDISLISVGENNKYGHPNIEVLEGLEQVKSQIYNTEYCGQITIFFDDGICVKSYMNE